MLLKTRHYPTISHRKICRNGIRRFYVMVSNTNLQSIISRLCLLIDLYYTIVCFQVPVSTSAEVGTFAVCSLRASLAAACCLSPPSTSPLYAYNAASRDSARSSGVGNPIKLGQMRKSPAAYQYATT